MTVLHAMIFMEVQEMSSGIRKAMRISGGHAVKRTARVEHWCNDCQREIRPGEEYYQLTLEGNPHGFRLRHYTKCICEDCWKGPKLEA